MKPALQFENNGGGSKAQIFCFARLDVASTEWDRSYYPPRFLNELDALWRAQLESIRPSFLLWQH